LVNAGRYRDSNEGEKRVQGNERMQKKCELEITIAIQLGVGVRVEFVHMRTNTDEVIIAIMRRKMYGFFVRKWEI